MDRKYNPALRVISTIVLSFFIWTFGGVFEVAYAVKESGQPSAISAKQNITPPGLPLPQVEGKRSEEKFSRAIEDIDDILKDDKVDYKTKKQRLKTQKTEIDTFDIELRKQFAETEQKIKDLPEVIKKRHRDFVKHYDDNLKELKTNLDEIEKAKTNAEADTAINKTKAFLETVKPPKRHQALDPNKLPHRTEEPVWKEPRTKPEEFEKEQGQVARGRGQGQPILIASSGPLDGLLSANTQYNTKTTDLLPDGSYQLALASPPTTADLAETIEVKFTPAITAKAAELGNDPTKIYEWVRNNIEYVPTYGSIQGADMCLQTKLCNDFDTASLLIALLRVSGIHARYVYGTIELPIEKVKNWAGGFTDTMSALSLFASAGVPTKGMTVGGEIKYARLEHTWVEAYIDYIPSRGSRHKAGEGDTWIPLDASFKQYVYTQGIDIKSAVPFDAQTFIDQIKNTATINETQGYVTGVSSLLVQQTMQDYQARVQNYISQNYPNATVGDVLGKKEIIKQEFPYLLGTLPYKPIVKGATYSSIPDSKRHKITFNVVKDSYDEIIGTPINITKSLPELAGKKITLSYSPATQADENVINSYLPKPHADGTPIQPNELPSSLPAYLINLKPELRIDGVVVATGTAVTMGKTETFTMTFAGPNAMTDIVSNDVVAGEYLCVALGLGKISHDQVLALKAKLESTKSKLDAANYAALTKEDLIGDLLYTVALSYHLELDAIDFVTAGVVGVRTLRLPSEAMFALTLRVKEMFGIPLSVSQGGPMMDVDRMLSVTKSIDGDKEKELQFMFSSGMSGSALEHSVPEQLLSTLANPVQGISAVKALQTANEQGIPIYNIDQSNINTILPQLQLDSGTISDIQNAVNAGKIVTVSKTDINFNGWAGCGYIVSDSNTGAAAYMISGGFGGARILNALKTLIINLYLIPSGKGFDEVGEAAGVIKDELSPLCAYIAKYIACLSSKFAEDFHDLIESFTYVGWSLVGLASKKIAARVLGFIGYVILVGGAVTYFYTTGMKCK